MHPLDLPVEAVFSGTVDEIQIGPAIGIDVANRDTPAGGAREVQIFSRMFRIDDIDEFDAGLFGHELLERRSLSYFGRGKLLRRKCDLGAIARRQTSVTSYPKSRGNQGNHQRN